VPKYTQGSLEVDELITVASPITTRKLLWLMPSDNNAKSRIYAANNGRLELVHGAYWNGSQWNFDDPGVWNALRYSMTNNGEIQCEDSTNSSDPVTWSDPRVAGRNSMIDWLYTSGGSAGSFFDTLIATTTPTYLQDGASDIVLYPLNLRTGDIVEVQAGFYLETEYDSGVTSIRISVYYDTTDHWVPGSHIYLRGPNVDQHFAITLYGRYVMPSNQGTPEIKIQAFNTAAGGNTVFRGEYYLSAKIIRP